MSPSPYAAREIEEHLRTRLPKWSLEDGQIVRTYETGDWLRSQLLANAIGFLAEAASHHPDLLLTYPRVRVMLTTHDAGGITESDFALAEQIEKLATRQPGPPAPA